MLKENNVSLEEEFADKNPCPSLPLFGVNSLQGGYTFVFVLRNTMHDKPILFLIKNILLFTYLCTEKINI